MGSGFIEFFQGLEGVKDFEGLEGSGLLAGLHKMGRGFAGVYRAYGWVLDSPKP